MFRKRRSEHSPEEQNAKEENLLEVGENGHSDEMVWEPVRQIRRMFKGVHDVTKLLLSFLKSVSEKPITNDVPADVTQEFQYIEQGNKFVSLPGCLQKTSPPVLIFCENEDVADDIHIYLLLKGVDAVAIHEGLNKVERDEAIKSFTDGKKDVLILTDVAAKGLDFSNIEHLINFDTPEMGNYGKRLGLIGRCEVCGESGMVTTFITENASESTLSDLKTFLKRCIEKIPTKSNAREA